MVYLEISLTESKDYSPFLFPIQMAGNREIAVSFLQDPSEAAPAWNKSEWPHYAKGS